MQLSPLTSYYIRKLLRQQIHHLIWVVAPGAALQADALADLDQVLRSLYLEESEIKKVVKQLETLISYHQALASQQMVHAQELAKIERTIFWLLGFKQRCQVDRSS
jgi:hypothetical protein